MNDREFLNLLYEVRAALDEEEVNAAYNAVEQGIKQLERILADQGGH